MISFKENYSLKAHNTFNIEAKTKYYFDFTQPKDLPTFLNDFPEWKTMPLLLLGGGSNLLFTNDFNGLIIHPKILGINKLKENDKYIFLEIGAGEEWDDVVEFAVNQNLGGIENLSLIPGKAGAAAVQNIGAYGVEFSDVVQSVQGFDLETFEIYQLDVKSCNYAYRDSIFKNELKNKFIVTSIILRLSKYPKINIAYGSLQDEINKLGETNLSNIRKAVINVRKSKLPDYTKIGNAGSFFMNPIVSISKANKLASIYPNMPKYPAENGKVKLAAGWLIDQCGWKGYRKGDAGVHENQALVIVNYGSATGSEIVALSQEIKQSVKEKFGININAEVNLIG